MSSWHLWSLGKPRTSAVIFKTLLSSTGLKSWSTYMDHMEGEEEEASRRRDLEV